jgi:4-oxalocrotonate tautomerase
MPAPGGKRPTLFIDTIFAASRIGRHLGDLHGSWFFLPILGADRIYSAAAYRLNSNSRRENTMPMLNVKLIEGVFTPTQKQEMIRKLTDAMVSIEGEAMRPVTWVVIEEVKSGDWGMGGNPITTTDVKARAAGKSHG